MIVVGDSLLKATEGPIYRPDLSCRVCCLPGAQVRDVSKKLPNLVWPSDCYSLLIIEIGRDEVMDRGTKAIKNYLKALGRLLEESGAQVVFSVPP